MKVVLILLFQLFVCIISCQNIVYSSILEDALPDNHASCSPNINSLGVAFRVDINSKIVSIKYYKSPYETGTHIGRIWSSNTLEAEITFDNETASGWQIQELVSPIYITSGIDYVVSVNCNSKNPKL